MIEFQADCGHTIRASERDAGKIIKCAYCGREVEAPTPDNQDTGVLIQEVDLDELAKTEGLDARKTLTIQGQQKQAKSAPSAMDLEARQSSLIKLALLLGFGTVCVVVLFIVFQSVISFVREDGDSRASRPQVTPIPIEDLVRRPTPRTTEPRPRSIDRGSTRPQPEMPAGRIDYEFPPGTQGLFVECSNPQARIYVREQDALNSRVLGVDESEFKGQGTTRIVLNPGHYRVAATVDLNNSELQQLPGFLDILSDLRSGDTDSAQDYFARDLSEELSLIEDLDVPQGVVRYYDVEIRQNDWSLISSLLVPGDTALEILPHVSSSRRYAFTVDQAQSVLDEAQLPSQDQSPILELLARAGQYLYPQNDDTFRLLEIDVRDGDVRTRIVHLEPQQQKAEDHARTPRQETRRSSGASANPWERGRSRPRSTTKEQEEDLAAIIAQLQDQTANGKRLVAADFEPCLQSGTKYTLYNAALADARVTFARMIKGKTASELTVQIGETLLRDPDLAVRLALLEALVSGASKDAVQFIDQRLEDIEGHSGLDAGEVKREKQALMDAKKALGVEQDSAPRNPWQRG